MLYLINDARGTLACRFGASGRVGLCGFRPTLFAEGNRILCVDGVSRLCALHPETGDCVPLSGEIERPGLVPDPERAEPILRLRSAEAGAMAVLDDGRVPIVDHHGRFAMVDGPAAASDTFRLASLRDVARRLFAVATHGQSRSPGVRLVRAELAAKSRMRYRLLRQTRVIASDWLTIANRTVVHPRAAHRRRTAIGRLVLLPRLTDGTLPEAGLLGGHANYYHHLIDYLPGAISFEQRGLAGLPLLTIAATAPFQRDLIEALGLASRLVSLPPYGMVKVRRLHLPEKAVAKSGRIENLDLMRRFASRVREGLGIHQLGAPLRLFVSRAQARTRRAANEATAIELARRFGFVPVILENLSFPEQVELFSRAEMVAGLHGAGLANLIFAPAGCRVAEFLPTEGERPGFFLCLSNSLGHPFTQIAARGSFASAALDLDLPAFERWLDTAASV